MALSARLVVTFASLSVEALQIGEWLWSQKSSSHMKMTLRKLSASPTCVRKFPSRNDLRSKLLHGKARSVNTAEVSHGISSVPTDGKNNNGAMIDRSYAVPEITTVVMFSWNCTLHCIKRCNGTVPSLLAWIGKRLKWTFLKSCTRLVRPLSRRIILS